MDPFVGELRPFAFGIIPRGWLPCNGSLLNATQYAALFSLLGNRYGGDGRTTFALPDLRGRTPLGCSATFPQGHKNGSETVTLTAAQVPSHTHQVQGSKATATANGPSAQAMAVPATFMAYAAPDTAAGTLNTAAVTISGGSAPHDNMQPSLVVNWCIATSGTYPPRQ
ncbi:phage tail protein [Acidovorax sp. YS12]|nr:phage tail protein [Acidovorax sp. YS12]